MQRIFAHDIVYEGRHYPFHVAQLADGETLPTFFPFNKEIHSTIYYPGTVEVAVSEGRLIAIRQESAARVPGAKS